jgi:hypothetical protein
MQTNPVSTSSIILQSFVHALESNTPFNLLLLYKLDFAQFNTAMDLLQKWHLKRYRDALKTGGH